MSLDTDVYRPAGPPPPGGFPLVVVFHGGGSVKDNPYDSAHAARWAAAGFVTILYSQRGDGNSTGQTAIAGPKEMHDIFDVIAWALGRGRRSQPPHPAFHIDSRFIALSGYSQGGLNTNLGRVWASDPGINPYGIRIAALEPGNTPDLTFQALVPNSVVKLSYVAALAKTFGVGSGGTEVHGRVAAELAKWFAALSADQPSLYGGGDLCDYRGHDSSTSTLQQDLAFRSVGCFPSRMGLPWLWAQAFDDTLFPADMAISMFERSPGQLQHRLYLSMGGHAAPAADPSVELDRLDAQVRFLEALRNGARPPGPPVVYWTRDPAVPVAATSYAYPAGAWFRQAASSWPPMGTRDVTYFLGSDGHATATPGTRGSVRLHPLSEDEAHDPIAQAAVAATPFGTAPVSAVPPSGSPGLVADFVTPPMPSDRELSGSPSTRLQWSPASPDTQLVLEVFEQGTSGRLTLISRGVQGLRSQPTGHAQSVGLTGNSFSVLIRRGERVRAWVMAGNSAFYKPYAGSAGGDLQLGAVSTLTLPLREPRTESANGKRRLPRAPARCRARGHRFRRLRHRARCGRRKESSRQCRRAAPPTSRTARCRPVRRHHRHPHRHRHRHRRGYRDRDRA